MTVLSYCDFYSHAEMFGSEVSPSIKCSLQEFVFVKGYPTLLVMNVTFLLFLKEKCGLLGRFVLVSSHREWRI